MLTKLGACAPRGGVGFCSSLVLCYHLRITPLGGPHVPRPTPDDRSGHLGTAVPKRDSVPHPPGPLESTTDLADRLSRIAGADLSDLVATDAQIEGWNATIGTAAHDGFEHRLLVGIAIQQQRPGHGGKRQNDAAIGERLGQSTRWVRETLRVAGAVSQAIAEGITIPLEVRDISWRSVPGAIENLRNGRALDFTPQKVEVEPTPEERAKAVAEALAALTQALDEIQSSSQKATLATEAIATLQPYTEPEPEPDSEPREPSPEPDPGSRDPSHPRRPGRNRPGRNPRRRRR